MGVAKLFGKSIFLPAYSEQAFDIINRDRSKFEFELEPLIQEVARIGYEANTSINAKSPYHFIYPR
ncbi:hypothetical protein CR159_21155 [Pollutimonas subterranea]|uniref:Uncharacterized protein n=1 Tax=Pollutimonas subterranea TaxID=2045210 RepID=A0A2N4TYP3_9BURK|nr:hypothetical protein CR159_21155 [Pollutimonas subterranea]